MVAGDVIDADAENPISVIGLVSTVVNYAFVGQRLILCTAAAGQHHPWRGRHPPC
jgi:hypothetical protein